MGWYSNERILTIIARGCAAVSFGMLVVWLFGAPREAWLLVLGIPAVLTCLSIAQYLVARQRRRERELKK